MAKEFTSDIKITTPSEYKQKATLAISTTGDIVLVDGREKLAEQILRAVVNEKTALKSFMNSPSVSTRTLTSLFTIIMRAFKQVQVAETRKSDPNFSGFAIYRKAAGTSESYLRVSSNTVTTNFTDVGLVNGTTYSYGITRTFKGTYETTFSDQFTITPYKSTEARQILFGKYSCIASGDSEVSVFVDYNRNFKASELLNDVVGIYAKQQADPRGYTVDVLVTDMAGNKVSISSQRLKA